MVDNECLDAKSLGHYVLGELDLKAMDAIESHLLLCEQCSSKADTLNPQDDVTASFPVQSAIELEDAVLAKLIREAVSSFTDQSLRETSDASSQKSATQASSERGDSDIGFLAPAENVDELGRLGGYRILQRLGAGGMGIVFRAEDLRLKRAVAIKVMKPGVAESEKAKERFLREAQSAAAIEHDNVVTILQVGEDRGVPFIAMPLLKGESLKDRLEQNGNLDENEVLSIGQQIAEGLAAAHNLGLIHRDIKPDNIWLEPHRDRVKLLDFGLARMTDENQALTLSGTVLGTPRYMSPEQATGQDVDARSDLFSLGSVLYHLASGQPPFDGKNLTATLLAVTQTTPVPLSTRSPSIRADLSELIEQLLEKAPENRDFSAESVAAHLARMQQSSQPDPAPKARQDRTKHTSIMTKWIGFLLIAILGTIVTIYLRDETKVTIESDQPIVTKMDSQQITVQPADSQNPQTLSVDVTQQETVHLLEDDEPLPEAVDREEGNSASAIQSIVQWENPPGYELEVRYEGDQPGTFDRHGMLMTGDPVPDEPFEIDGIFFSTREGRPLTDADMNYLVDARLIYLRTIGLKGQPAKAAWFDQLGEHQPHLQAIFLEETATIDVLRSLLRMPQQLQSLILGGVISDEGLEIVTQLASLSALHFDMFEADWQVSPESLELISRFPHLAHLYFYRFEPANLDKLRERMPGCRFHFRGADGELKVIK